MVRENDMESQMNRVCSREWKLDIELYLCGMTYKPYSFMSSEDQRFVFRVHRHLYRCRICKTGFRYLCGVLSSSDVASDLFSSEQFRLLRENEDYLSRMIVHRKK